MLKPLHKRVVLKAIEQEETTLGGLVLPNSAKEKQQFAEVVAIATDVAEPAVGDKVVYQAYAGTTVKDNGEEYVVIEAENILAIIE